MATITEAEMDRRRRIAALASDLLLTIDKHAADKMTSSEVLAALAHEQSRFIAMLLQEESTS